MFAATANFFWRQSGTYPAIFYVGDNRNSSHNFFVWGNFHVIKEKCWFLELKALDVSILIKNIIRIIGFNAN